MGKRFEKGKSGNPSGRPPIILPEIQKALDANRNHIKILILQKLEDKVSEWVTRIIEKGTGDGDIVRFKTLVELALGKMVDIPPDFPTSGEERELVREYRRRKGAAS